MSQKDLFAPQPQTPPVLSVYELTVAIKELLENSFPTLWVCGEISNFSRPQSGHCYLTLKDDRAQIRAAIWRNAAARVKFDLRDGLEVICQGRLDVYAPRGSYQLIIERIEPKGIGALELALRQLREKLAREGLFDAERKRPLPRFVRRVAVVTSPTGAAIHDFLQVLGRRRHGPTCWSSPRECRAKGPPPKSPPPLPSPIVCRWPSTVWWSPAAAAVWRTFGRSMKKRWCGQSSPRGCRSSPPSAMKWT